MPERLMKVCAGCWECGTKDGDCILVSKDGHVIVVCRACAHPTDGGFWDMYWCRWVLKGLTG